MNRKVQYTVPNMEQPCGQELELLRKTAHPDSWVRPLCSGASSLDPTLLGIFYFISFEVWLQTLFLLNFHLVAVVCGIIDPLPDISLVFHRDGSYGSFGGRSCRHAELHVHVIGKSGRHFPVRAKFKVAEETVWVTGS